MSPLLSTTIVKDNKESHFHNAIARVCQHIIQVAATILPMVGVMNVGLAQGQQIIPAVDGTGTILSPHGNRIDIQGGTTSRDGANLFHSFQEFGLQQGQIANFLANPNIQNILGRITGGNPSLINGLIQVTGGNPNLLLMNPSGFVFGPNSSLNVPAAFTVTTANGVGFGNSWFNAVGSNNYADLVGQPNGFAFTMSQPGAIINTGNLSVNTGQTLSLLGGTVINTGQLTAQSGQILVTAVPGQQWVRLSQPGNLLSLEIQPFTGNDTQPNSANIAIASIPELLTLGNTGITANGNTIKLPTNSITIAAQPGTNIISGKIDVSGNTGGKVNIFGDKVGLVAANINASGHQNGGTVLIGGDYQGKGTVPNAQATYIDSQTVINTDSTNNGNGGRTIVWADNQTDFFGQISAKGGSVSGDGGFVEVSGKNNLNFQGTVDTTATNGNTGTLLLDPSTLTIIDAAAGAGSFDTPADATIFDSDPNRGNNTISWGAIGNLGTNIILQATGDITINAITSNSPFTSGGVATLNLGNSGSFQLASTNGIVRFINTDNTIKTLGGSIDISGTSLTLGNLDTSARDGTSGNVRLSATSGDIDVGNIITSPEEPANHIMGGGNVDITASQGSITTGFINTSVNAGSSTFIQGTGGSVSLTAAKNIFVNGDINASVSVSSSQGDNNAKGGNVTLQTTDNSASLISFNSINTQAGTNNGTVKGGDVQVLTNGLVQGFGRISESLNTIDTSAIFFNSDSFSTFSNFGGTITIKHDGGADNVPFIVGTNNNPVNGTRGRITRGDTATISSDSFPVLPNGGNALGTTTGITITSVNTAPTLTSSYTPNFTAKTNDVNLDNTSIVIENILVGQLRQGNKVLSAGDIFFLDQQFDYIPPPNARGNIHAFTIKASDRVSFSPLVPVFINFGGTNTPNTPTPTPPSCDFQCNKPPEPPKGNPPIPSNPSPGPTALNTNPTPEDKFTSIFANQLGVSVPSVKIDSEAREIAVKIESATGVKPAFIYISFAPIERLSGNNILEQDTDQLEIVLVTGKGEPIRKRIAGTTKAEVLKTAKEFRDQITIPYNRSTKGYLKPAQQLYNWIISPIKADLQAQAIQNLVFLPDVGLRSTPLAALHDGERFLVEQYSIGLMPSLSLTNTLYTDIKKSQLLAMGVSESTQGQDPLPAVPAEVSTLVSKLWPGKLFLNKQATVDNLKFIRSQQPFGIIHLATHANFSRGSLDNSYIQLWDNKLRLNQIRQLGFNNPQVEMLVLSACKSALGDEEAEIGFAGLAIMAGVKTSVASLWAVNDSSTALLMTKFYESLRTAPIRAEALREAQIAMAKGQIYIQNGQVRGLEEIGNFSLPATTIENSNSPFTHPFYWAAFTMVGNPW
ncbi:filamentous hemagglutinin family outer membrane protein [Richelia sinica FACHB-800]|uniref:Filamentous hemagglutinin family outer membrane protein n=1 Tax=Richelia sinica FACHB-800 TaxID=1357546 RepID=A0A975TAT9_9NOST|nr:CHAT domain-containing protein [Richelia sinica]MBD2666660.1 CHAT domain-containing protein [Richelia sinica FACHB-800]QXE25279.1 filamentous hemagglutinin family outer membrane protein [Richelia sinica FACHB-800]